MKRWTPCAVTAAVAASAIGGGGGVGCLSRPVVNRTPALDTVVNDFNPSRSIDKVDILFDIDNSASMGDKQAYLGAAIPDLVKRFVDPECVDDAGMPHGPSAAGSCPQGSSPEFAPVHDLHLGIVSSSLGQRGGDLCARTTPAPFGNDGGATAVLAHDDDQAHLLNRTLSINGTTVSEGTVPDASPDPLLYWFPSAPNQGKTPGAGKPVTDPMTLATDFTSLVHGTGIFGCGIESQLESWYRFLVQPDPYDSIVVNGGVASWSGVDTTILRERHDFLRPDSLVLVVVLSDENDSEIDVRALNGQAVAWMNSATPLPRGTSGCSDPSSPACQSCAQGNNAKTDPACMTSPSYTTDNDWGFNANLRHVHMKAKYGVDPQFPIDRYVTGLTSNVVPNRDGEYPPGKGSYVGQASCVNPLFAAQLPDGSSTDPSALCSLTPGARTKDLVFFAHIGGVPSTLLHFTPNDPKASALTTADWVKILGTDPEHYDYSGIDPHMIESYAPRTGVPGPSGPDDAISGHDWVTDQGAAHVMPVDREYACTFRLAEPRDCTLLENASACDCPSGATKGLLTPDQLPPICNPSMQTQQTGAKAYPTVRELLLAKKLGPQGVVSSICPIHVADNTMQDDPLYGYRPAVAAIIERLRDSLSADCLPQKLQVDADAGGVNCLILLQIPNGAAGTTGTCLNPVCPASAGLAVPKPEVLSRFCQDREDTYDQRGGATGGGGADPANVPVCVLQQLTSQSFPNDFPDGSCAAQTNDKGWCYLTGSAAKGCPQEIVYAAGSLPSGASASLQCVEQSVTAGQ
ncbi:MAG: hypothetical protein ACRENE_32480 [Polyangiaceae bacterium]